MIEFAVKLRPVGLLSVGWSHPTAMEVDIPFTREVATNWSRDEGRFKPNHILYIPGSTFKGALRSSAVRIASAYGFSSCGMIEPRMIAKAHEEMGEPCDVCQLFGCPGLPIRSPLMVSDFQPIKSIHTTSVTRVRIDDRSLKVAAGALFSTEHVTPDAEFLGKIRVSNIDARLLGLLLLSLAELRLGRFGRRSLVDIKLENCKKL